MKTFRVTRTETYSADVDAESREALQQLLDDADTEDPAFVKIDESLEFEECGYDIEDDDWQPSCEPEGQ